MMIRQQTRNRARALQLLYALESGGRPLREAADGLARLLRARGLVEPAEQLVAGVRGRLTEIDELIQTATEHWRLERVATIDRAILRLACSELLAGDVPPKVVIDEALWLAHRFGTPGSPGFVNGVLDRVARTLGRL
jgi:N utilization substance protein B